MALLRKWPVDQRVVHSTDNGVDLLRAVEIVYDGAPNPEVYATTASLVDYQWIQAFRATVWRRG